MSWLLALFDWRSFSVFRRNLEVYLHNWRTAFFPPAMEPVVYFLALGFGLRGFIGTIDYDGIALDYATYVAPGLIAYAAFTTPFYESLYSAYVRMFYQKTWDGILATQVELEHLVWGEILWAAFRGFLNGAIIALVLVGFSLGGLIEIQLTYLPIVPVLGLFAGIAFSAFALVFTAIVPAIDHMNYPVFLVGVPLSLASNTYFPVSSETRWIQVIIELNPVYQLAESSRALLVGGDALPHLAKLALTTLLVLLVAGTAAMKLTRRRVLT